MSTSTHSNKTIMNIITVLIEQECEHFARLDGVQEALCKTQKPIDSMAKIAVSSGEES